MKPLTPKLTRVDQRVLDTLPTGGPGLRVSVVHGRAAKKDKWTGRYDITLGDVLAILRGLEAIGLAEQRAGWWRQR